MPRLAPTARIDLHAHSTHSDGTEPPAEVVRQALIDVIGVDAQVEGVPLASHASGGGGGHGAPRQQAPRPATAEPSGAITIDRWPASTSARSKRLSTCSAPPTGSGVTGAKG